MLLKDAVAKRIIEIMKDKDLNQYKLSKLTGVAESTLSTLLNTETKTIKLSTLYDICAGLKIEFKDFFDSCYLLLDELED